MSDAAPVDEQRVGRIFAVALPVLTVLGTAGVGLAIGPATGILVAAAGVFLGVIAILWGSIRILSGDAPLPPELADLDTRAEGADALANRKKMLLRALKDLESERAIGKIEPEDYEQLSGIYRSDLKDVLQKMDDVLAPRRGLAEEAAREHLIKSGVFADKKTAKVAASAKKASPKKKAEADRIACPKCKAMNDHDAKFCKECAAKLGASAAESADA